MATEMNEDEKKRKMRSELWQLVIDPIELPEFGNLSSQVVRHILHEASASSGGGVTGKVIISLNSSSMGAADEDDDGDDEMHHHHQQPQPQQQQQQQGDKNEDGDESSDDPDGITQGIESARIAVEGCDGAANGDTASLPDKEREENSDDEEEMHDDDLDDQEMTEHPPSASAALRRQQRQQQQTSRRQTSPTIPQQQPPPPCAEGLDIEDGDGGNGGGGGGGGDDDDEEDDDDDDDEDNDVVIDFDGITMLLDDMFNDWCAGSLDPFYRMCRNFGLHPPPPSSSTSTTTTTAFTTDHSQKKPHDCREAIIFHNQQPSDAYRGEAPPPSSSGMDEDGCYGDEDGDDDDDFRPCGPANDTTCLYETLQWVTDQFSTIAKRLAKVEIMFVRLGIRTRILNTQYRIADRAMSIQERIHAFTNLIILTMSTTYESCSTLGYSEFINSTNAVLMFDRSFGFNGTIGLLAPDKFSRRLRDVIHETHLDKKPTPLTMVEDVFTGSVSVNVTRLLDPDSLPRRSRKKKGGGDGDDDDFDEEGAAADANAMALLDASEVAGMAGSSQQYQQQMALVAMTATATTTGKQTKKKKKQPPKKRNRNQARLGEDEEEMADPSHVNEVATSIIWSGLSADERKRRILYEYFERHFFSFGLRVQHRNTSQEMGNGRSVGTVVVMAPVFSRGIFTRSFRPMYRMSRSEDNGGDGGGGRGEGGGFNTKSDIARRGKPMDLAEVVMEMCNEYSNSTLFNIMHPTNGQLHHTIIKSLSTYPTCKFPVHVSTRYLISFGDGILDVRTLNFFRYNQISDLATTRGRDPISVLSYNGCRKMHPEMFNSHNRRAPGNRNWETCARALHNNVLEMAESTTCCFVPKKMQKAYNEQIVDNFRTKMEECVLDKLYPYDVNHDKSSKKTPQPRRCPSNHSCAGVVNKFIDLFVIYVFRPMIEGDPTVFDDVFATQVGLHVGNGYEMRKSDPQYLKTMNRTPNRGAYVVKRATEIYIGVREPDDGGGGAGNAATTAVAAANTVLPPATSVNFIPAPTSTAVTTPPAPPPPQQQPSIPPQIHQEPIIPATMGGVADADIDAAAKSIMSRNEFDRHLLRPNTTTTSVMAGLDAYLRELGMLLDMTRNIEAIREDAILLSGTMHGDDDSLVQTMCVISNMQQVVSDRIKASLIRQQPVPSNIGEALRQQRSFTNTDLCRRLAYGVSRVQENVVNMQASHTIPGNIDGFNTDMYESMEHSVDMLNAHIGKAASFAADNNGGVHYEGVEDVPPAEDERVDDASATAAAAAAAGPKHFKTPPYAKPSSMPSIADRRENIYGKPAKSKPTPASDRAAEAYHMTDEEVDAASTPEHHAYRAMAIVYMMFGTYFFPRLGKDNLEMVLWLYGQTGTGKTTVINEFFQGIYGSEHMSTVPTNIEPVFGISAILQMHEVFVAFVNEITADTSFPHGLFMTLVTDPCVRAAIKFKESMEFSPEFKLFLTSNKIPLWPDQGSTASEPGNTTRRIFFVMFLNQLASTMTQTKFRQFMQRDICKIFLRVLMCHSALLKCFGVKEFWQTASPVVSEWRRDMTAILRPYNVLMHINGFFEWDPTYVISEQDLIDIARIFRDKYNDRAAAFNFSDFKTYVQSHTDDIVYKRGCINGYLVFNHSTTSRINTMFYYGIRYSATVVNTHCTADAVTAYDMATTNIVNDIEHNPLMKAIEEAKEKKDPIWLQQHHKRYGHSGGGGGGGPTTTTGTVPVAVPVPVPVPAPPTTTPVPTDHDNVMMDDGDGE